MTDEVFEKQREGYMVKKVEIPKKMHSQGNKFWNEITNHQFCFDRRRIRNKNFVRENLVFFCSAIGSGNNKKFRTTGFTSFL